MTRRDDRPDEPGAALLQRTRDGDVSAFERLVAHYQKAVLNTAYRYLGDRAAAEEVCQEVFVRVYQARDRYQPTARFSTWLYRIVMNLCANTADRQSRRRAESLDDERSPRRTLSDPNADPPDAALDREEMKQRVLDAIGALPDAQRAAIVLARYEEMSLAEIAAVLETTADAVKSLLFRARENLRQRLMPYVRQEVPE